MIHGPPHARGGIGPIVDEVAQAQANVEGLTDRLQRRPIRMDVGDNEYSHKKQI